MSMRCRNCGDTLQEFLRVVDDGEQAYVAEHKPRHTRLGSYYRCGREGCRRYQRLGDHNDGGSFPEPDE
ncbi:hypothetical protein IM697_07925 [Streptomyces ferrugineus]|uniref:Uncharacterized protein n=1 Tax=Streptomyces ferrugineus TaxID=1413221 RepID=A0A7M2SY29_9ACTN|nr:hypothetical protein IM697_07925 [Streptomyces ferrugineus]